MGRQPYAHSVIRRLGLQLERRNSVTVNRVPGWVTQCLKYRAFYVASDDPNWNGGFRDFGRWPNLEANFPRKPKTRDRPLSDIASKFNEETTARRTVELCVAPLFRRRETLAMKSFGPLPRDSRGTAPQCPHLRETHRKFMSNS